VHYGHKIGVIGSDQHGRVHITTAARAAEMGRYAFENQTEPEAASINSRTKDKIITMAYDPARPPIDILGAGEAYSPIYNVDELIMRTSKMLFFVGE